MEPEWLKDIIHILLRMAKKESSSILSHRPSSDQSSASRTQTNSFDSLTCSSFFMWNSPLSSLNQAFHGCPARDCCPRAQGTLPISWLLLIVVAAWSDKIWRSQLVGNTTDTNDSAQLDLIRPGKDYQLWKTKQRKRTQCGQFLKLGPLN